MAQQKYRVTRGDYKGSETYGMNPHAAAVRLTGKRSVIVERTDVPGQWTVIQPSRVVEQAATIVCVMVEI